MGKSSEQAGRGIFYWKKKLAPAGELQTKAPRPAPVLHAGVFDALRATPTHNPTKQPTSNVFAHLNVAPQTAHAPLAETPVIPPTPDALQLNAEQASHTKTEGTPAFYEQNTQEVKQRLQEWGMGPTVEFLQPEGFNRDTYLQFARERLLPGYVEGQPLPSHLGEVEIPENVRQHGQNIDALLLSINLGLGHYRVAKGFQNTIDVLGGHTKSVFIGGGEGKVPRLTPYQHFTEYWKTLKGSEKLKGAIVNLYFQDPELFLQSVTKIYNEVSRDDAYNKGMIHQKPEHLPHTPYDKKVANFIAFVANLGTKWEWGKKFREIRKNPYSSVHDLFAVKDNQPPEITEKARANLRVAFLKNLIELIKETKRESNKSDLMVIATHFGIANVLADIPEQTRRKLGVEAAHLQPDELMVPETYVPKITYTESPETLLKWGYKNGLDGPVEGVALEGYLSPLPVYERQQLTEQRRQALLDAAPITVVATASGVADTQLGAFKEFMQDHADEMKNGSMRMVIQCGCEQGGALPVYDGLTQTIKELEKGYPDIAKQIVLHVAKKPEDAIDFWEAVSWAPVPMALLVKGSEQARIAQSLNIPHIPTGTVGGGGHEIWNIAMSLLKNKDSVVFPTKTGQQFYNDVKRILPNDIFVQRQPDPRAFMDDLLNRIQEQTPATPQEVTQCVRDYILSGHVDSSRPDAMLNMLSDILSRRENEQKQHLIPQDAPVPQPSIAE